MAKGRTSCSSTATPAGWPAAACAWTTGGSRSGEERLRSNHAVVQRHDGDGPATTDSLRLSGLHAQLLPDKGQLVGGFLDDLRGGFARAVAGLGLDADERPVPAALHDLETCGELEAVCRHHAGVVLTSDSPTTAAGQLFRNRFRIRRSLLF